MRSFILLAALLSLLACGSSETASTASSSSSSGTPEAGDGKVHPPGNGTHETEAAACTALTNAQTAVRGKLSCAGTSRTCPDFLRFTFVTACLEYDQGSVAGCVAYYNQAKTCDELNQAITDCVITSFPGTMSAGCTM